MIDDHKEYAATSKAELEEYIMNPCIAKNEAEWWASREIERLRGALMEAAGHLQHAYIMGFTERYKDAANAAKAALEGK